MTTKQVFGQIKIKKANNKTFQDFKKISTKDDEFNKIIDIKDFNLNLFKPKINNQWKDVFYNYGNNTENFRYKKIN